MCGGCGRFPGLLKDEESPVEVIESSGTDEDDFSSDDEGDDID